ncbi:hypothetical protein BD769DRAFT_1428432 [Suillus cothurnatus]|nr:hypothetical protein BD769DRAFT_1428432 [Suillus cothurnatus]
MSTNSARRKDFNSKLSSESRGIGMYCVPRFSSLYTFFAELYQSTVMVAVNVSFLSVLSVDLQDGGSVVVISTCIYLFCIVRSLASHLTESDVWAGICRHGGEQ